MNIKPKKSLGQNFLINTGVIQKILNAAEIKSADFIVEIGPGGGILTKELGRRANRVVAIEKDSRLIDLLQEKFAKRNLEVIEGDALDYEPTFKNYKVVGNS